MSVRVLFIFPRVLHFLGYDAIFTLDFFHDEGRLNMAYALARAEHFEHKALIVLHRRTVDLEEIVRRAAHIVAFRHLAQAFHTVYEILRRLHRAVAQFHTGEDGEAAIQLLSIENRDVLLDDALALHALYALEDGGTAQMDHSGYLFRRQTGV